LARDLSWGDIRLVELDKPRPALVLTRSSVIPYLNTVTVAPISRTIRGIPTEVRLGVESGLKDESAANLDHIVTVGKGRVGRWIGSLSPNRKPELRAAINFAFELEGGENA
jgi:mRNA interferase MazF